MTLAGGLITMANQDADLLNNIIIIDETWYFFYDPWPKSQSCEWKYKSPQNQKFCLGKSKGKVMSEVFFDTQGLIHYKLIPEGHTVNKVIYIKILHHIQKNVHKTAGFFCITHLAKQRLITAQYFLVSKTKKCSETP
jgi:hypothetical protein